MIIRLKITAVTMALYLSLALADLFVLAPLYDYFTDQHLILLIHLGMLLLIIPSVSWFILKRIPFLKDDSDEDVRI